MLVSPLDLTTPKRRRRAVRRVGRKAWRVLPWPAKVVAYLGGLVVGLLVIIGQIGAFIFRKGASKK